MTDPSSFAPGWHTAIIVSAGHLLTVTSYPTYADALTHLRQWYAGLLADQDPDERADLIAAFGDPTTATVAGITTFYEGSEPDLFWCDVVPAELVLPRLCMTLLPTLRDAPHAAIVLAEGTLEAQSCDSYDQALAVLRERAAGWELDGSDPDPATATVAQLSQLYGGDAPGMWLGVMPLIATAEGPAVLVPIARLSPTV